MIRIAVTGKEGQVVTALRELVARENGVEIIALGRPELDLARLYTIEAIVRAAAPDVIISAAAYTAVDKAESDPVMAGLINGSAPAELAKAALILNIPIIHLSTDYVFSGDKVGLYTETDEVGPISVYGHTKLAGEKAITKITNNYVILRTAWVYSPYGSNFVKTMLRLGETRDIINVVADQRGVPTYAFEIARALIVISRRIVVDRDPVLRGVFHLTAQGEATWAEFASEIFTRLELRTCRKVAVNSIQSSEYPTPAKRPNNSRLSGEKLAAAYGIELEFWQKSLDHCLDLLLGAPVP